MPPRSDDQATRDAGLALLLHTLSVQLVALVDRADRIARAIETSAAAIETSTKAANPWAVAAASLALGSRVIERLPPWGLVGLLAIPAVGVTVAGAPAAGPLLASVLGALLPGGAQGAPVGP